MIKADSYYTNRQMTDPRHCEAPFLAPKQSRATHSAAGALDCFGYRAPRNDAGRTTSQTQGALVLYQPPETFTRCGEALFGAVGLTGDFASVLRQAHGDYTKNLGILWHHDVVAGYLDIILFRSWVKTALPIDNPVALAVQTCRGEIDGLREFIR